MLKFFFGKRRKRANRLPKFHFEKRGVDSFREDGTGMWGRPPPCSSYGVCVVVLVRPSPPPISRYGAVGGPEWWGRNPCFGLGGPKPAI
jgi:hypothetical protein